MLYYKHRCTSVFAWDSFHFRASWKCCRGQQWDSLLLKKRSVCDLALCSRSILFLRRRFFPGSKDWLPRFPLYSLWSAWQLCRSEQRLCDYIIKSMSFKIKITDKERKGKRKTSCYKLQDRKVGWSQCERNLWVDRDWVRFLWEQSF